MPADRRGPLEEFLVRSSAFQSREHGLRLLDRIVLATLAVLAFGIVFGLRQDTPVAQVSYAWVQMMPDQAGTSGGRLLRAIILEGDRCPTVEEDDRTIMMQQRPPPARAAFPILLCEAKLRGDSMAQLGSWTLPSRPAEPNDIVVIGDTGCRVTYYSYLPQQPSQQQSCRDDNDWPFRKNASSAAAKITSQSFVLHLGDFHYREHPCADSNPRCGGTPYGDNWATWRTEFFEPADPLLRAAPWVIMRGNHEDCSRAGAGWLFFFAWPDQQQTDAACDSKPTSYNVTIGKTDEQPPRPRILLVMDTSDEKNRRQIQERCAQYAKALEVLDQKGGDQPLAEYWLALHQPLWGRQMDGKPDVKPDTAASNPISCVDEKTKSAIPVIRQKFEARRKERLARLVLSGDTHAFQFFSPLPTEGATPVQIIAGNGGTQLDPLLKAVKPAGDEESTDKTEKSEDETDQPEDRTKAIDRKYQQVPAGELVSDEEWKSSGIVGSSLTFVQYGFTVMHRDRSIWTATQFDSAGRKIVACHFSETLASESDPKPGCDSPS